MKTSHLIACISVLVSAVSGCGFAARSPEMYRDDTKAVLQTKSNDIRACYDGVLKTTPGAAGKVTVKFDVENEQGKIVNVTVDKPNTTAPDPVAECVTKSIAGLGISPPDARLGQATFVWEFSAPAPGVYATPTKS
ncbi:MAG: hypothetical protein JWP87_6287 [Labilithrix sp.]|jgi:uncharacterized protein with FMN-binding domain|nr:hypothetical protein [Labilithrix sp.]